MATMVQHRLARGRRSLGQKQGTKIATLISRLADRNQDAARLVLARYSDSIPVSERRAIEAKLVGVTMISARDLRIGDVIVDGGGHIEIVAIAPHGLFFNQLRFQCLDKQGRRGSYNIGVNRTVKVMRKPQTGGENAAQLTVEPEGVEPKFESAAN